MIWSKKRLVEVDEVVDELQEAVYSLGQTIGSLKRIGADTTELEATLDDLNSELTVAESELFDIDRLEQVAMTKEYFACR